MGSTLAWRSLLLLKPREILGTSGDILSLSEEESEVKRSNLLMELWSVDPTSHVLTQKTSRISKASLQTVVHLFCTRDCFVLLHKFYWDVTRVYVCLAAQSCLSLCDPTGSLVHGDSSEQEYWSGLSCPSSGDLPQPGAELFSTSAPLAGRFSVAEPHGKCSWYYSILYRALEYPWILLSLGAFGTNPPWIPKDDCNRSWIKILSFK